MYTINSQDNKNVRKEGNMFKYLYVYNYFRLMKKIYVKWNLDVFFMKI